MAANSNQMNKYNQPAFMFDIAQLVKLLVLIAQYNYFLLTQNNMFQCLDCVLMMMTSIRGWWLVLADNPIVYKNV